MMDSLIGVARIPEDPVAGVLYASALVAHPNIFSLGATYGPDGKKKGRFPMMDTEWAGFSAAAHPVTAEGLTAGPVLKAYAGIVSGVPEALAAVSGLAKKTGVNAEQAQQLLTRTEAWLLQRYTAWEAKSASIDAYLEGRALVDWLKSAPNMKDQNKVLGDRLKEWAKDALKDELTAYKAYATLGPMAFSNRKTTKDQARTGLEQVVAKYGSTVYGRQCSVLRQAMDAPSE